MATADAAAAEPAPTAQGVAPESPGEHEATYPGYRPVLRATIGFAIAYVLYSIVDYTIGDYPALLLFGPVLGLIVKVIESWALRFRVSRDGLGRWVATRWQMGLVQGVLVGAVIGLTAGQGDLSRGIGVAATLGVGFGVAEGIIEGAESLRARLARGDGR